MLIMSYTLHSRILIDMRKFKILLLLLLPLSLSAQNLLRFDISNVSECGNNNLSYKIFLVGNGNYYESNNGIYTVENGNVFASIEINRGGAFKTLDMNIEVPSESDVNVKIILPKLMEMSSFSGVNPNISHHFYYHCSKLADGHHIDHYENGNVRIKGTFSQGKPNGDITTFFKNGNINYIAEYSKKGKFKRTIVYLYNESFSCIGKRSYNLKPRYIEDLTPLRGFMGGIVGYEPEYLITKKKE